MTPTGIDFAQERLAAIVRLAALIEHFENGRLTFPADHYRALVQQLAAALRRPLDPTALQAILDGHPAAAELYENLHYAQAGLARSPIDASVASERLAVQAIHRANVGHA